MDEKLAELVERQRKSKRIRKYKLCEKVGISITTFNNWLKGIREPSYYDMVALLNALGLDIEIVRLGKNEI